MKKTQLASAKKNITTNIVRAIARREGVLPEYLRAGIKKGTIVIPLNNSRRITRPCAVGSGLRTKINANLGTSTDNPNINKELEKLRIAIKYGADAVMDLSVGGDLKKIRQTIINNSSVPVGTVPIYEVAVRAQESNNDFLEFGIEEIVEVLKCQAEDGVDFFTIHAGVTRASLRELKKKKRILNIVSRGGAILASWIDRHKRENPFYEHFDRILELAARHDITISLGDGLRPGSVLDATDGAQIAELKILGKLALRAREKNVQVIIEGPGHVPINQIKKNILLEKKICRGAPFYVLGPLVTDIASGYDHISSAIGGAIAASEGADFLCYVTPSEHLRHPSSDDVRVGVIASKIAAHAADIAKGIKGALQQDTLISEARRCRDWKKQIDLCVDPQKAARYRRSSQPQLSDVCTMCGKYCAIKLTEEAFA